jgi:hypothetical protein
MNDFVLLFRINPEARQQAMGTPERAQQNMQKWLTWIQQLESNGNLKARGQPLDVAGKVVGGKTKLVTDGPFVEAKDIVSGFLTIRARDLTHAAEVAKDCPILEGDGSVEVRPVIAL